MTTTDENTQAHDTTSEPKLTLSIKRVRTHVRGGTGLQAYGGRVEIPHSMQAGSASQIHNPGVLVINGGGGVVF